MRNMVIVKEIDRYLAPLKFEELDKDF